MTALLVNLVSGHGALDRLVAVQCSDQPVRPLTAAILSHPSVSALEQSVNGPIS
jgi:hypothetical protein